MSLPAPLILPRRLQSSVLTIEEVCAAYLAINSNSTYGQISSFMELEASAYFLTIQKAYHTYGLLPRWIPGIKTSNKLLKLRDYIEPFDGEDFTNWFEELDGVFAERGVPFARRTQQMLRHVAPEHRTNFQSVHSYAQDDYLSAMGMLMDLYRATDSSYKRHPEDWKRHVLGYRVEATAPAITTWILEFAAMEATCKRRGIAPPTTKELVRAQDPDVQDKLCMWFQVSQDSLENSVSVERVIELLRQWAREGISNWQLTGDARYDIVGNSGDPETRLQLSGHGIPPMLIDGLAMDPSYVPIGGIYFTEPAAYAAQPSYPWSTHVQPPSTHLPSMLEDMYGNEEDGSREGSDRSESSSGHGRN